VTAFDDQQAGTHRSGTDPAQIAEFDLLDESGHRFELPFA